MLFSVENLVNILEVNQLIRDLGENKTRNDNSIVDTNEDQNCFITTLNYTNLLDEFEQFPWNLFSEPYSSFPNQFENLFVLTNLEMHILTKLL